MLVSASITRGIDQTLIQESCQLACGGGGQTGRGLLCGSSGQTLFAPESHLPDDWMRCKRTVRQGAKPASGYAALTRGFIRPNSTSKSLTRRCKSLT
ncbi:MAG TPA: hypothetical protein PLK47_17340, partial [Plasticicumulans sp.]|nr:hypothetical protein [Plasticicumulans sp.]